MASQAQNIYDDPGFFSAYSTLPRSQGGLESAPEWPVLEAMITKVLTQQPGHEAKDDKRLTGQSVLDLGCGYGWFSRWARSRGASKIRATDISTKMIERAKEFERIRDNNQCDIMFERANLEELTFGHGDDRGTYDLVYSSLTFHYIEDLSRLLGEIRAALKQGGNLVFSVEHPICSAPIIPGPDWKTLQEGDAEHKVWPLNSYSEEGWRYTSWLGVKGVKKYHRTVETYVSLLLENGFVLTGLKDWVPSTESVSEHPEWAQERHRPYFLLISAKTL